MMVFDQHSSIMVLLAGVSFFMFGMSLASEGLEKIMANRMRELLGQIAKNRLFTVGIGILLTVALQSSGAVTSMLVGLGSAGVVRLPQVMGLILGSAIGSTITVQLISFNISHFGLPMFVVAFTIYFMTKKRGVKNILSVAMGFGLLFFGIELIGISAKVIQQIEYLSEVFSYISKYPYLAFLISVLFTGLVHSSAVTIGFVITMAAGGLIDYSSAIYWVLGANVGTTSTALMASVGGGYVGRQVAWAHFLYRMASALLFLAFIDYFSRAVLMIPGAGDISRDIANAHTVFNIMAALIFLPFIEIGAKFIERLLPPKSHEQDFSTEFLQANDYHSTTLALAFAKRELMRMADIVLSMIRDSIHLFEQDDPELISEISKRDNEVDHLHHEIKLFLVQNSNESKEGVTREVFELISFANDLESAADVIDNVVMDLAKKKQALKLRFSDVGWSEIQQLHGLTMKIAAMSITAFQTDDIDIADEVIRLKREIRKVEKRLRESHIDRLNQGLQESINTSSIHLDILGDFRRIVGLLACHAYVLRKKRPLPSE